MCPDFTSLSFCQIKLRTFPLVFLFFLISIFIVTEQTWWCKTLNFSPSSHFSTFCWSPSGFIPVAQYWGAQNDSGPRAQGRHLSAPPAGAPPGISKERHIGHSQTRESLAAWCCAMIRNCLFIYLLLFLVGIRVFLTQITSGLFLIICLILIPSLILCWTSISITHTYGLTPVCQRHSATGHGVIHTPDEQNRWPLRHFHLVDKMGVSQTSNPKNNVRL